MRPVVTAFALGTFAFGALALLACVVVAALADAGGQQSFEVSMLGIPFLTFARDGASTATTFGAGVALAALAGGLANAAGAVLLARIRRRRS